MTAAVRERRQRRRCSSGAAGITCILGLSCPGALGGLTYPEDRGPPACCAACAFMEQRSSAVLFFAFNVGVWALGRTFLRLTLRRAAWRFRTGAMRGAAAASSATAFLPRKLSCGGDNSCRRRWRRAAPPLAWDRRTAGSAGCKAPRYHYARIALVRGLFCTLYAAAWRRGCAWQRGILCSLPSFSTTCFLPPYLNAFELLYTATLPCLQRVCRNRVKYGGAA